jgi:hypothetical protein
VEQRRPPVSDVVLPDHASGCELWLSADVPGELDHAMLSTFEFQHEFGYRRVR